MDYYSKHQWVCICESSEQWRKTTSTSNNNNIRTKAEKTGCTRIYPTKRMLFIKLNSFNHYNPINNRPLSSSRALRASPGIAEPICRCARRVYQFAGCNCIGKTHDPGGKLAVDNIALCGVLRQTSGYKRQARQWSRNVRALTVTRVHKGGDKRSSAECGQRGLAPLIAPKIQSNQTVKVKILQIDHRKYGKY